MELVSEIDAPPDMAGGPTQEASTALGGKQRADVGGAKGRLNNLETLSARPKRP